MRFVSVCGIVIAVILVAIVLTGCATTDGPVRFVQVHTTVPKSLRSCGAEPYVPSAPSDVEDAHYVNHLRTWGRGCQSKLGSVVGLVDAAETPARK